MSLFGHVAPGQQTRWLNFRNDSGETAPGFAVMRVVEVTERGELDDVILIRQPRDGNYCYVINGPQPVGPGKFGRCTFDFPAYALFDGQSTSQGGMTSQDIPRNGQEWGPENNSWKLVKGNSGFRIWGNAYTVDEGPSLVMVSSQGCLENEDGSHLSGTQGTGGASDGTGLTAGTGITRGTGLTEGTGLRTDGSGITYGTGMTCGNCPGTLVLDSFSADDGRLLNGKFPDDGPGAWLAAETYEIISNKVRQTGGSGVELAAIESCRANVTVSATLRVTAFGGVGLHDFGLIGRFVDANNYWLVVIDSGSGGLLIQEVNAGSFTTRAFTVINGAGVAQMSLNTDYTMTFVFNGTSITATFNGYSANCTSSVHQSATIHGLLAYAPYGGTYNFDNFLVTC